MKCKSLITSETKLFAFIWSGEIILLQNIFLIQILREKLLTEIFEEVFWLSESNKQVPHVRSLPESWLIVVLV